MDSLKISIISIFIVLTLPLIVVFCIGMFAWFWAKAITDALLLIFKE